MYRYNMRLWKSVAYAYSLILNGHTGLFAKVGIINIINTT